MPRQALRKPHVLLYFAAILAFLYLRTFLLPGTPLAATGDETMFFEHAIRLLHGQVPYRDYENFMMPGSDLFYAAAFRLFGVHAWLAQTFSILIGTSIAALLLWISHSVLAGATVYLPGLLFLVLDFNVIMDATHHWYSDLFLLAAAALLIEDRGSRHILTAGTLCGIAAIFTQSQGLLGLIAIAAWLWCTSEEQPSQRFRQLATLLLPFAVVVCAILAYCVSRAGLTTMYFSLVTFVFRYFPTITAHTMRAYFQQIPPHHKLTDLVALLAWLYIHLMLPFGYLWCIVRLWRVKSTVDQSAWKIMLLITLIGLALFVAIANSPSPRRMVMVAPPAAIVCVWLLRSTRARAAIWTLTLAALVILPIQMQMHWRGDVQLPIGRAAFLRPAEYDQFQWLAQHTQAGESSFNGPQINFDLSLDNPTTVDFVVPAEYTTTDQVQSAIRGLEQHRTPLITFYDQVFAPPANLRAPGHPGNNLGPLLAYVSTNYHMVKAFPTLPVWERN